MLVTCFNDLASAAGELNERLKGKSRIASMSVRSRTCRIFPIDRRVSRTPGIVERHGISLKKIIKNFKDRGVL
ncbi:MAG: hypothetical protein DRP87_12135 [Spirochaetes bacterium]|nr:MAG: hypothetical protein DRP87_12135 [Spirochaetota bacterium]